MAGARTLPGQRERLTIAPTIEECSVCHGEGCVPMPGQWVDACPRCAAKAETEFRIACARDTTEGFTT